LEGVDDGGAHRAEQGAPAHQREHAGEQRNRQSEGEAGYEKFTFDRAYLLSGGVMVKRLNWGLSVR
jgi:hypothetical protein